MRFFLRIFAVVYSRGRRTGVVPLNLVIQLCIIISQITHVVKLSINLRTHKQDIYLLSVIKFYIFELRNFCEGI